MALTVMTVIVAISVFVIGRSVLFPAPPGQLSADPQARDYYERGQALWAERGAEPTRRAISMFQRAVDYDPDFAEAWSALASAWLTLPTYAPDEPQQAAYEKALLAADRALSADPDLSEARLVFVVVAQRRGDWVTAREIYDQALAANPDNINLHIWAAEHYRHVGWTEVARTHSAAALAMKPTSSPVRLDMIFYEMTHGTGKGEAALDQFWFEENYRVPIIWYAKFFAFDSRSDHAEMRTWLASIPQPQLRPVFQDYIELRERPDPAEIAAFAADLSDGPYAGFPETLGFEMLIRLGAEDAAMQLAEAAAEAGRFELAVGLHLPERENLRASERFADITEQFGFQTYWKTYGPPDMCAKEATLPYCIRIN